MAASAPPRESDVTESTGRELPGDSDDEDLGSEQERDLGCLLCGDTMTRRPAGDGEVDERDSLAASSAAMHSATENWLATGLEVPRATGEEHRRDDHRLVRCRRRLRSM